MLALPNSSNSYVSIDYSMNRLVVISNSETRPLLEISPTLQQELPQCLRRSRQPSPFYVDNIPLPLQSKPPYVQRHQISVGNFERNRLPGEHGDPQPCHHSFLDRLDAAQLKAAL